MAIYEDYLVMPENGRWTRLHNVASHESAYSLQCCWHNPKTRIAVKNCRTGKTKIFIREVDSNGIVELKGDGTL